MFGRLNAMKKTVGIVAAGVVAGLIACSTPAMPFR